jgi:ATP-dependent Clp endopeptidase proteolytic subunit ClpP
MRAGVDLAALVAEGQKIARAAVPDPTGRPGLHSNRPRRFEVCAEAGAPSADVYLYGSIGGWFGKSAADIVEELRALDAGVTSLRVHIDSLGGDVFDGLAIYNTLRQFDGTVETIIEGAAASIASVIALAGKDGITMMAPSMLMIHEPHAIAFGGADDMRAMAKLLDKAANVLADTYVARTKQPKATVRAWMAEERWFEPDEAKAEGFVDTIIVAQGPKPAPPTAALPAPAAVAPVVATPTAWRRALAERLTSVDTIACAIVGGP